MSLGTAQQSKKSFETNITEYKINKESMSKIKSKGIFWSTELLKFMFFKKATKIDEIFTVDLTLCIKCQIDNEDFVYFCGLIRKHEL